MNSTYEHHIHGNPDFPFIFHDVFLPEQESTMLHWHESIELLYFEKGVGIVLCDSQEILGYPGDLVVVNSHTAHRINAATDECFYKCIILDSAFTDQLGVRVGDITIDARVHDLEIGSLVETIYAELSEENLWYQARIKALAAELMIYLCRNYASAMEAIPPQSDGGKVQIAKDAILFIREHYRKPLTVDKISDHVGFSKYYLSRIFKEVSGTTLIEYVTSLRCEHARKLIRSGNYNISESAERCGYNNLSYFTRSYKKIYGILPSEEQSEPEIII